MAGLKILITEDERIVAEDIRDRLLHNGYVVAGIASSSEEAIEMTSACQPDLVLMDIRLRGVMDGMEAAQDIRSRFDIPVIYLTAYADDTTFQQAMLTEPFGYLLKPIESRELHTSIEMAYFKHKMERNLKESQRWLSTTLRSMGDAVIATDAQGLIKFMNPVAEQLTGWTQEDALGRELGSLIQLEKPLMPAPNSAQVLADGLPVSDQLTTIVSKSGRVFPIDDTITPIRDDKGVVTGVVLVFKDVSERLRAEEIMKEIPKRILETQEAERRRVARELHDGIIQLLSSVRFRMNMHEEAVTSRGESVDEDSIKIRDLLEKAIIEVRRISRNLRPSELDDLGLVPAIRVACEEFQERRGIQMEVDVRKVPRELPSEIQLALYRILQESLNNIEKHAEASKVIVTFHRLEERLVLRICDNGVGFDPRLLTLKKKGQKNGLGFLDMRERAEFIGARLTINSQPKSGTEIIVEIPNHQPSGELRNNP